ncbi:hypothetical protein BZL30_7006 [Mycobacterium kansasii]|uniref:Uncharacterized protein n=1 Tax=Mycobacterium kansasii TaxID=1768 RepID=A0A1V3WP46_MYCKA|nr:hypothetical protein BZL30_7006 [Mycobacterium kansasii]
MICSGHEETEKNMTAKQPAPTLVAGRNRHWPARTHKQRRSRPSQVVRHLIFAGETMPQRWNPEWALVRVFRELPSTVGCRRASPPAARRLIPASWLATAGFIG